MKVADILPTSVFDDTKGAGATPYNADVDYFGMRVQMKPSTFLSLAKPATTYDSAAGLAQYVQQGGKLGSPMLFLTIPEEWADGDFAHAAKVEGHEGRNRAQAFIQLFGDVPMSVHLFPRGARARNITQQWVDRLNKGILSEHGKMIQGPLFTR